MVQQLFEILRNKRFNLTNEKQTQADIEKVFVENNVNFKREHYYDKKNIVDFKVENVAVEVKIKGTAMNIFRQCERYCSFDEVHFLILLTNKSMGLPKEINGKPCYVFNLSKAWL